MEKILKPYKFSSGGGQEFIFSFNRWSWEIVGSFFETQETQIDSRKDAIDNGVSPSSWTVYPICITEGIKSEGFEINNESPELRFLWCNAEYI